MSQAIRAPLPRDPACGAAARHLLDEQLGPKLAPVTLADAKIVVSELVNNAYLHGDGRIELRMQLLADRLRVEVVDEGENATIAVREHTNDVGGNGLKIVQALCASWGAFAGTTHVWAELEASSAAELTGTRL
jgi:anti-sigma regulatory factor (Ser/Thr protein kinase)